MFWTLSFAPMLIGALAAVACALPGTFLLLRRQALMGDTISHVALPGIVVAFLLTGTLSTLPMMLGAGAMAVLSVVLIEGIRRLGRIETGAAMGVVFTAMFAGGVLLLEQSAASGVHIDVEHALMGNLESLIWFEGTGPGSLVDPNALAGLPPQIPRLLLVLLGIMLFIGLFWRALVTWTFDPDYARTTGLPVDALSLALVTATAIAAVAAFEAVGSILVIAMFVCPPASARLLTDRLPTQLLWSAGLAVLSAVLGYILAGYGPLWLGYDAAVSAAGMIATVSGLILALACLVGPKRKRVGVSALSV
jgi:manganese/zinc/iron transport system permease protein